MITDLRAALQATIDRADPPGAMHAGTPEVSVAVLRSLLHRTPTPPTLTVDAVAELLRKHEWWPISRTCLCGPSQVEDHATHVAEAIVTWLGRA